MPKENIQLVNNPWAGGKPYESQANPIWAKVKVTVKNAGMCIASIGNQPCTHTG